ncbi:MAG: TRAP transporter substrate-binding protein [Azospirillaceae bacterium]
MIRTRHDTTTTDVRTRTGLGRRGALKAAGGGLLAGGAAAVSAPNLARGATRWRMVTSWPKGSAGPGDSAERVAARIGAMSGGRLTVDVYGAGELVPAFEVFDAVADGSAEMAHTASVYWTGKAPAAAFYTTVPFGLTPREHAAWLAHGGGQALWDRLYEPFGIKPFAAGNTGTHMAGWFNAPIEGPSDLEGLRVRIVGLGGEILRRMGAAPVTLPAGEIFGALQSGAIDGAEFLGPWIDSAFGFQKAASVYHWPGWSKPNGTGEALVGMDAWNALDADLKRIVAEACAAEAAEGLAEADRQNAAALDRLISETDIALRRLPAEVIGRARVLAEEVLVDSLDDDPLSVEIRESYMAFRAEAAAWSRVGPQAALRTRDPADAG